MVRCSMTPDLDFSCRYPKVLSWDISGLRGVGQWHHENHVWSGLTRWGWSSVAHHDSSDIHIYLFKFTFRLPFNHPSSNLILKNLAVMQVNFRPCKLLIIEERSVIGFKIFPQIDLRLRAIMARLTEYFGMNILLFRNHWWERCEWCFHGNGSTHGDHAAARWFVVCASISSCSFWYKKQTPLTRKLEIFVGSISQTATCQSTHGLWQCSASLRAQKTRCSI